MGSTGSPIADIAYLTRSEHRAPTLVALAVRPRSRSELWEMTGVSSSTIRRTLSEFEDRNWIRKDGYQYETTQMGAYIASAMAELIERVEIEQNLRDVWHWLPGEESGFTIEMCDGAVVTVAEANNPYAPINRFRTLIGDTDRFSFIEPLSHSVSRIGTSFASASSMAVSSFTILTRSKSEFRSNNLPCSPDRDGIIVVVGGLHFRELH